MDDFIPNARLGKRILTETPGNIAKFCDEAPLYIVSRVANDALGDGLDTMDRYAEGLEFVVGVIFDITEFTHSPDDEPVAST